MPHPIYRAQTFSPDWLGKSEDGCTIVYNSIRCIHCINCYYTQWSMKQLRLSEVPGFQLAMACLNPTSCSYNDHIPSLKFVDLLLIDLIVITHSICNLVELI